jgi:hypothetical protein
VKKRRTALLFFTAEGAGSRREGSAAFDGEERAEHLAIAAARDEGILRVAVVLDEETKPITTMIGKRIRNHGSAGSRIMKQVSTSIWSYALGPIMR